MEEENSPLYFGEWVKRRRQELDLTQAQLAKRACCTVFTIRKIEIGERRPSRQLAELLAQALAISSENQTTFIKVARGELSLERLPSPVRSAPDYSRSKARPSSIPGYLPRALTPFIGRETELAALGQLLCDPQCSLLTIVGPGGIGKTRLAIEAARRAQAWFPDGVWFVSLTALNSPFLIIPAIAAALDFKFQDPTNPQTQLFRHLRSKRALLVLDNAEHLIDGVGVFSEILKDCPQLKLLVTSRERLSLLSEWVFEVLGLPVPPDDQTEQFEMYSSIALFLQSARRNQTGYKLREVDRGWVLKICQRMEGLPVGIELSAAWVGILSCEEIAREIERNFDFVSASMRDLPVRHRSLRSCLDHSWNLLNAEEKLVFSRLSVFQGSFRREAAQEICGANLAVLSSLRNKTLLHRVDQEHYVLHDIIRQYAELKLGEDPGEDERVKDRYASYYVGHLSEWEKALKSARQLEFFHAIDQEIDNLSRGWHWMVTRGGNGNGKTDRSWADQIHSALFSLSLFYENRCRCWEAVTLFTESVEHLKHIQDKFSETGNCSRFNSVLGHITAYLGFHYAYVLQFEKACGFLEEAIRLLENSQSWIERAQAQIMLASIFYRQGHYRKSALMLEQGRDVFRETGESWWYLLSLIHLARAYLALGKLREGEALCQEGFRLPEQGDMRLELMLRIQFAYARFLLKDYAPAERLMQENLQLSHQYRNHRMIANIYIDLSKVMLSTDRVDLAETYLQESIKLLSEFGESDDLAYSLLHLGKCLVTRMDFDAARQKFRQVIKIGQALDMFYLVYWGWVNKARIHLIEGHPEKALEIMLVLGHRVVEYREAQDEGDRLLADLRARLPEGQLDTAMKARKSELSSNQALAHLLSRTAR